MPSYDRDRLGNSRSATLGDHGRPSCRRPHARPCREAKHFTELGPATLWVVHHPADPHCTANVAAYRELLTSPTDVVSLDLAVILDHLEPLVEPGSTDAVWLDDFRCRYLDLSLSEPLIGKIQ